MRPLERLTHRVSVRSGIIVLAAIVVLALSSTSCRRVGRFVIAASVVGKAGRTQRRTMITSTFSRFRTNRGARSQLRHSCAAALTER
jgi:hypothetical protein